MMADCWKKCKGEYDCHQSLKNHLLERGKNEDMHKYMIEFMEEWLKQYKFKNMIRNSVCS
jgi:hypothetical protein